MPTSKEKKGINYCDIPVWLCCATGGVGCFWGCIGMIHSAIAASSTTTVAAKVSAHNDLISSGVVFGGSFFCYVPAGARHLYNKYRPEAVDGSPEPQSMGDVRFEYDPIVDTPNYGTGGIHIQQP